MARRSGPPPLPDDFIAVGRVLGAHGIHGDLRIELLTDNPGRFAAGKRLFINGTPYTVAGSRKMAQLGLLKLTGIETRDQAHALRDTILAVPTSDVPKAKRGYYHHQLIGLRVVSTAGEELGLLVEIAATGANDVYLVRREQGDFWVPAIADVVKSIDIEHGVMTVEPLPGLL